MRFLCLHPWRLTPRQVDQLFLLAKQFFHWPAAALALPRVTRCAGVLVRDQVQMRALRLPNAHPRQTHLSQSATVYRTAGYRIANPVGKPIVQRSPERIDPLPLSLPDNLMIGRDRSVPDQPVHLQVAREWARRIPAIEDHVAAADTIAQRFAGQIDSQIQFGTVLLRQSAFLGAPQPKAQRDAQWSPTGQQNHDIDCVDVAPFGGKPQPFGPRQGLAGGLGDDHVVNNPNRGAKQVGQCACQRTQGCHQQRGQIALTQQTRELIVASARQIATDPQQRGAVVNQNETGNIGCYSEQAPATQYLVHQYGLEDCPNCLHGFANARTTLAMGTATKYGTIRHGGPLRLMMVSAST